MVLRRQHQDLDKPVRHGLPGLKPTIRGDWMAAKWGVRRGFIKPHVGMDAKTKKNCAVPITDDRCGVSPQSEELVYSRFLQMQQSLQTSHICRQGIAPPRKTGRRFAKRKQRDQDHL